MHVTFKSWEGIVFLCCLRLTGVRVINTGRQQEEATWCNFKVVWSCAGKVNMNKVMTLQLQCPPWSLCPPSLSWSPLNRVINNQPIWTRAVSGELRVMEWSPCNWFSLDTTPLHHYTITTQTRRPGTRIASLQPHRFHDGCRQVALLRSQPDSFLPPRNCQGPDLTCYYPPEGEGREQ